jgi:hypothetical protein
LVHGLTVATRNVVDFEGTGTRLHWLDCLNHPDNKHIVARFIVNTRDMTPAVAEFAKQFIELRG